MSYQEKRSLVNLTSSILIMVVYSALMIQRYPQADPYSREIMRFWGAYFLILIPVSIIARILIYIVFSILHAVATREEDAPIVDEREKLIELRAGQLSFYIYVIGVMLAMGALVIDLPPAAMFIILICAGVTSEIVGEIAQFYYYRRGI